MKHFFSAFLVAALCVAPGRGDAVSAFPDHGGSRWRPVAAVLQGKIRRDPLTDAETDQLRDTAPEPEKRFKLFVKFAQERLNAADQLRSNPKGAGGRGLRIHDLIEDFTNIVDELDENVEDYDHRNTDLRKALKTVIEGDTEFQLKLRAWKQAGAASDIREYEFVLDDATESVNTSLSTARNLLQEQNQKFEKKKK